VLNHSGSSWLTQLSGRRVPHLPASGVPKNTFETGSSTLSPVTVLELLESYGHVRALLSGGHSVAYPVKLRSQDSKSFARVCGSHMDRLPRLLWSPKPKEEGLSHECMRPLEKWAVSPNVTQTLSLHSAITCSHNTLDHSILLPSQSAYPTIVPCRTDAGGSNK
jgi:hypothetical protein